MPKRSSNPAHLRREQQNQPFGMSVWLIFFADRLFGKAYDDLQRKGNLQTI
jgi:hypothetical protein